MKNKNRYWGIFDKKTKLLRKDSLNQYKMYSTRGDARNVASFMTDVFVEKIEFIRIGE